MKCPKCSKEGFKFKNPKHFDKETKTFFRINYLKYCKSCGYTE